VADAGADSGEQSSVHKSANSLGSWASPVILCQYSDCLGYHLLVLVYRKTDDASTKTSSLQILHALFVDAARTADYQTTAGIRGILERDGNIDDLTAFFEERNLPLTTSGSNN